MFALKYTFKVVPTTVPTPRAEAPACISITPVGAPDLSKGTSGNSAKTAMSKRKKVINDKEQVEKTIFAEER